MTETEPASGLAVLFFITFVLTAYFLPAIIAAIRRHHNRVAITVLNTALGWTLLGWIAALVWASTATDVERVRSVRRMH